MPAKKKKEYVVKVELESGEVFESKGKTIDDALNNLELDYTRVKSKGTVHLSFDGKKSSKFFYLRPLRRVVASKLSKAQVGKDLVYLLA